MRILIINSEFPPIGGGAGKASANLAREFSTLNHQVTVLTVAFDGLPKMEVWKGTQVIRVAALRRRVDRSNALEQAIFLLTGAIAATKLVRQNKPDVVLAFFGIPAGVIALWLRIIFRIPYVVSLRGGDVPGFRPYDFATYHRLLAPLLHTVWQHASAIVANSQGLRALAQVFDSRFEIQVIPNGVDLQMYALPTARRWKPPHLLFVGRVVYQKGLDLLVEAVGDLKHLPWQLSIVGDGPERDHIVEMAIKLGVVDRLCFLGWMSEEELIRQYQLVNLFVFPSRHEGMPNAVLEAMATGLPVIATAISGNEELIVPGVTGLLVPPLQSQGLKNALSQLITNDNLRKRMGEAGRELIKKHFTWNRVSLQYLELLKTIGDHS